jgi:hypothetical protein
VIEIQGECEDIERGEVEDEIEMLQQVHQKDLAEGEVALYDMELNGGGSKVIEKKKDGMGWKVDEFERSYLMD